MAQVPADYIRDAPVWWEYEILQALGLPLDLRGFPVPPPTFATLALLEVLDNDFLGRYPECDMPSVAVALWCACETKTAALCIRRELTCDSRRRPAVDAAAVLWLGEALAGADIDAEALAELHTWFCVAFSGYEMMPRRPGAGGSYLFGAPTMGRTLAAVGAELGVTWHAALWDTPVCLLGHIVAQQADMAGVDGVSRRKDEADIRRQIKLANEREAAGELHPWQERDPLLYPLTAEQLKHPAAQKAWTEAAEKAR